MKYRMPDREMSSTSSMKLKSTIWRKSQLFVNNSMTIHQTRTSGKTMRREIIVKDRLNKLR